MGAPGTTPGEWSTTGIAEGSEFEVRAGDQYVCACPFDTEPFAPVPPYSEARANAHQSAASPDLYDALEIMFRHWSGYVDPEADSPGWPDDPSGVMNDAWKDGFFEKARSALAKARGE